MLSNDKSRSSLYRIGFAVMPGIILSLRPLRDEHFNRGRRERSDRVVHWSILLYGSAVETRAQKIRLFVKPFCGWCHEAKDWLDERGLAYEELDVTSDRAAFQEMRELSGQTLAPVIEVDGEVLADFDTGQLEKFWKKLETASS